LTTPRTATPAEAVSPGLLFACVLGLLLAGTAALWTSRPGMGHPMNISRVERPSDDYYLAYDGGANVEHHVLYFGLDEVATTHLRQAEVLLLGNSRLMFALRPGVLDPFFRSIGLRYYVLGFGFREADRFPLAIIEKFDLRPRYVVVNADGFFTDSLSDAATETTRESTFAARQHRWESETTHAARRALHRLVPNWVDLFGRPGFLWRREVVAYRSRTNGTWEVYPWEATRMGVDGRDMRTPALSPREIAAAQRFKAAMDARGASLVLTFVPTPKPMAGGPGLFAELLQVPLVTAHPFGIGSHDGDHLDYNSAIAWSEALVRELARVIR
jgi:hypothetical protein